VSCTSAGSCLGGGVYTVKGICMAGSFYADRSGHRQEFVTTEDNSSSGSVGVVPPASKRAARSGPPSRIMNVALCTCSPRSIIRLRGLPGASIPGRMQGDSLKPTAECWTALTRLSAGESLATVPWQQVKTQLACRRVYSIEWERHALDELSALPSSVTTGLVRRGTGPGSGGTRAGTVEPPIPKLRHGSYFPGFPEHRQRAERALVAVVAASYLPGVSTRRVEKSPSRSG
jgi:hypothetical protein